MSRNLPFLREVTAVVEEIESIRDEMSDEARVFFGWRPYAEKWAFPNPVWTELRQAFQEGRDDAEKEFHFCPAFCSLIAIIQPKSRRCRQCGARQSN